MPSARVILNRLLCLISALGPVFPLERGGQRLQSGMESIKAPQSIRSEVKERRSSAENRIRLKKVLCRYCGRTRVRNEHRNNWAESQNRGAVLRPGMEELVLDRMVDACVGEDNSFVARR
ncbi:hypothetical protein C8Q76DRAFT_217954 [Earliella scabrosa]|nr:hypothetical protein C8Q76DRAFT_217954 [Earliella scabrosa]